MMKKMMIKNKFPKESFNLREAKGKDYYKIMMVNESLKGYGFKDEFPWCLHFDIEIREVTELHNLPTKKEADILNKLEDRITSIIRETVSYQFIGRITDNGHRELFFYVASPKEVHEKFTAFVEQGNSPREFEYSIAKDENWGNVEFFFDY